MSAPVTWFEITSRNSIALREFYAQTFGWQMQPMEGDQPYAVVETGGEGGDLGGIGDAAGANRVTFYIAVDDPQAYLDRVERSRRASRHPPDRRARRRHLRPLCRSGGKRHRPHDARLMAGATLLIEYLVDDPSEWRRIFDADPLGRSAQEPPATRSNMTPMTSDT